MFVITAKVPDHSANVFDATRIVIGCNDQALHVGLKLDEAGIDYDVAEATEVPERSQDETLRAQRLMALLFVPAIGNA